MFLNMLNSKEQKNFLELANIAINVDKVVSDDEKRVIEIYRREMLLLDYEIKQSKYEDLVKEFQMSTKKVKKAIIIELAGVLDADGIDENESKWIDNLGKEWGFREAEINKMVRWTQDFNDLLDEALTYINKRSER